MAKIAEMHRTGRSILGSGSKLIELEDDGLKHTMVVFDAGLRALRCLNSDLEIGKGFMEQPEITGLARLVGHDPDAGGFLYPTGTVWSIGEVVRELGEMGEVGGTKAALELCYLAGEVLVDAADKATHSGLSGHGGLDPWRLLLKPDGQVMVLGYGLPRAEIELYLEDPSQLPGEDSLRYCAPENLGDEPFSDLSSDLFSLSLIALELMVGKPVYNGLAADIQKQASRGEAGRRLYQWRDRIPTSVREVFGRALKPDADARHRDGLDFVYGVHDLLGGIDAGDGPTLREVVMKVRGNQRRKEPIKGGESGSLSPEELAELAEEIDGAEPRILPPPRKPRPQDVSESSEVPRWGRANRRSATAASATEDPPPRRRGRSRSQGSESARQRLLRRLRNRDEQSDSSEALSAPAPRRRSRRARPPVDETPTNTTDLEEATQVCPPPPSTPAPAPSRRSRSSESSKEKPRRGRAAALLERLRSTSGEQINPEVRDTPRSEEVPPKRGRRARSTKKPVPSPTHETKLRSQPSTPEPTEQRIPTITICFRDQRVELQRHGTVVDLVNTAVARLYLPTHDLLGSKTRAYSLEGVRSVRLEDLPAQVILQEVPNTPLVFDIKLPNGSQTRVVMGAAVEAGQALCVLRDMFSVNGTQLISGGRPVAGTTLLGELSSQSLELLL